jgi:hypothetical protein
MKNAWDISLYGATLSFRNEVNSEKLGGLVGDLATRKATGISPIL